MDDSSRIPDRLLRAGRAVDPVFDSGEELYRRCRREQVVDGRLAPPSIPLNPPPIDFPGLSVNRSRYSEPTDVRIPSWPSWGVARWFVHQIPERPAAEVAAVSPKSWSFAVEHVPENLNYSHSEIRSRCDGLFSAKLEPPKLLKKWLRQVLSDSSRVIIEPLE